MQILSKFGPRAALLAFLAVFSAVTAIGCNQDSDTPVVDVTGVSITVPEGVSEPVILRLDTDTATVQLGTVVTPDNASDKTIIWRVDHSEIATVTADGLVSAVSVGDAVITAETNSGGKTATKNITVLTADEPIIPVESVSIPETLALTVGDAPQPLTYTVLPANATIKTVTWASSDSTVVSIDETTGAITVVGEGEAVITVTTQGDTAGGEKAADTCAVTVSAQDGGNKHLVKFNVANPAGVTYDGTGTVGAFGSYAFLLYPHKINLTSDKVTIQAKIKFTATSGHNGVGFINAKLTNGTAYSLVTAQNIKNNQNGGGGSSFDPAVTWTTDKEYIFRAVLVDKRIDFYVFEENTAGGLTELGYKQGAANSATTWYEEDDIVYPAIGGSNTSPMVWSDITVTVNGTKYGIDGLDEQSAIPSLAVTKSTLRIAKGSSEKVTYTATQAGGTAAEITAVSSDPAIVWVDSHTDGNIVLSALEAGTASITVTNSAAPELKAAIQVTVTDFPASDSYGNLTGKVYPAPGAAAAYTDGELMITFDSAPVLVTGGSIGIYNKTSGVEVDTIAFADEVQTPASTAAAVKVGNQLARIDGNSVYFTPHFGKLANDTEYYIAIPRNSITGTLNTQAFDGLSDDKATASWSFTTRAPPTLGNTITVDGSQTSTADFRTVYGALEAVASKSGNFTINIAPGTYTELVHYKSTGANVTLVGQGSATYGTDVVIQYTNCNDMNGGTHTRSSTYFSGVNVVLKNLTLKNTTVRGTQYLTGVTPSSNSQAESLFFANGTGKTLAAYNCSFLSHQDTIQTTGRNWFYKCYIEGDTDYIWGTADACVIEDCELVSVNDPLKSTKEAILLVARTGSTTADPVPKGYVILNSKVTVQDGMTTYFGRNPGAGSYYDQAAVVNTAFTLGAGATIGAGIWRGSTYTYLEGAEEHVGWKVYGNTVGGVAQDTSAKYDHSTELTTALYEAEYSGRNTILNRVYTKATQVYADAASIWSIDALKTDFNAPDDPTFGVTAVTGVTLDKPTLTLTAGGATGVLTAAVAPSNATNKAVTWESSNTAVATMSGSGLTAMVTPLTQGTTTITVTTTDGSHTAVCAVTVEAGGAPGGVDKTWNFSEAAFDVPELPRTNTAITASHTVDGLTVLASSSATVMIDGNNKSIDGFSFTYRLKLGGTGSPVIAPTGRGVKFDVTGPCTIKVYYMSSSGGAARTLAISNGSEQISTDADFTNDGNAIAKGELSYSGGAGSVYVYSKGSGINMYGIVVDYP
ncbi:hypothetical protein FACS1894124_4270 [Spirochaetia bacterium]|nr:hypothetical protein FACS1894124_4270 [Spirochaetia bacterium]